MVSQLHTLLVNFEIQKRNVYRAIIKCVYMLEQELFLDKV